MTALQEAVARLAAERRSAAIAVAALAEERAWFEKTYADVIADAAQAKEAESEAERIVRTLAVDEFKATGNKAPCVGVSIVLTKELAYDKAKVTEWALAAMPDLITPAQINVKAFEKIARTVPLPMVTITETPAVRIASELPAVRIASELPV